MIIQYTREHEALNVGVVLVNVDDNDFAFKFTSNLSRIQAIFPEFEQAMLDNLGNLIEHHNNQTNFTKKYGHFWVEALGNVIKKTPFRIVHIRHIADFAQFNEILNALCARYTFENAENRKLNVSKIGNGLEDLVVGNDA